MYNYGSEWHLLHWLSYHRNELNGIVELAIAQGKAEASPLDSSRVPITEPNAASIQWLDTPWAKASTNGRQSREWRGVEFIADAAVKAAWKEFWPKTGSAQCWDAVGLRMTPAGPEWLLVEAKAHTGEMVDSCTAGERGAEKIREALQSTRMALEIDADDADVSRAWMKRHYQFANRVAALFFLNDVAREVGAQPIRARHILVYMTGEGMPGRNCPASSGDWDGPLDDLYRTMGLVHKGTPFRKSAEKPALMRLVHEVYLPAITA